MRRLLYCYRIFLLYLVAFRHSVAYAHLGENVLRLRRLFFYLAPDIRHIYSKYLIISLCVRSPELLYDIIVGQHSACILAQKRNYFELVLS